MNYRVTYRWVGLSGEAHRTVTHHDTAEEARWATRNMTGNWTIEVRRSVKAPWVVAEVGPARADLPSGATS